MGQGVEGENGRLVMRRGCHPSERGPGLGQGGSSRDVGRLDWRTIVQKRTEKERPRKFVCLGDSWSHLQFSVEGGWQVISGGCGGNGLDGPR